MADVASLLSPGEDNWAEDVVGRIAGAVTIADPFVFGDPSQELSFPRTYSAMLPRCEGDAGLAEGFGCTLNGKRSW